MNKEFVAHLKSRISIIDVVSSRIRLHGSGNIRTGLCPFHKERTGSFRVDESKGLYHCFGCGAGGDTIKFVMEYDKVSFQEALEILAVHYGIPLPKKDQKIAADPHAKLYEIMNFAKNYFIENLNNKNETKAIDYLNLRGIKKEFIEKFQLGFAPNNSDLYKILHQKNYSDDELIRTGIFVKSSYNNEIANRYRNRLIFPIIDSAGKCVGFGGRILEKSDKAKYINSPETEIYVKSNHLYGYHLAKKGKSRQIIITEGYMDVISMHQAGFDGTVAPLGTAFSETQIGMCWKICNDPVIALDGDSAGIKASYRWIDKILACLEPGKSFKFASLPQGSDPDLLVYNKQISAITNAINNAVPLSSWMWDGAFSLFPSQTPEQKAELVQMLLDKVQIVKNESIKNFYIQDFKKKEFLLWKSKKKISRNENLKSASSAKEKIEKIFVVTILNHPYIMNRVIEDFVKLEFESNDAKVLKERILKCYTDCSDINKFAEMIKELQTTLNSEFKGIELHANFVNKNVSDENAVDGWFKLLKKYLSEPLLQQDLQKMSTEFNFSEDNWKRLKALKSEVILNRIKR